MLCRRIMGFFKACSATAGVLTTLVAAFLIYGQVTADVNLERHSNPSVAEMTIEQKSSHMISYLDEDGKETTLCTATAIGPHALLTASHCNDGARHNPSTSIKIDYSAHHYEILAVTSDDRDHDIYLIDGPALKYTVTLNQAVPVTGEKSHFYGFGEGVYPSSFRTGHVRIADDPSDVDASVQFFTYDMPAYHGDSGSAIYNSKNEVIGIVSYGLSWYGSEKTGSYALDFSPSVIETASHFGQIL